jgi:hypothetical protein
MKGKRLLSILMVLFGFVILVSGFLVPQYSQMCSCANQIVGQQNSCNCDSASPNGWMLIGGIVLIGVGLVTIMRPGIYDKITSTGTGGESTPS